MAGFFVAPPRVLGGAQCTFVTRQLVTSAAAASNTFTGISIGTASATRLVIVGVGAGKASGSWAAGPITGVTFDGNAGTQAGNQPINNGSACAFFYRSIAAGTTSDIVVSAAANATLWSIVVWAATNLNSTTPTSTADTNGHLTGSLNSSGLTIPSNGFGLGYTYTGSNNSTVWTNLTEDCDDSNASGSASGARTTTPGNPSITATYSTGGSTGQIVLALAAWA